MPATMKTQHTLLNGVPVTELEQTIEAVRTNPELGRSEFRASNRWINGGHNRSRIQDFYGAGEERSRPDPFTLDNDEPPVLHGTDLAPNPVENLLGALAGCVTTTFVYYAAVQGVELQEVESELVGHLDLQGLLGTAPVKAGYEDVKVTLRVKSNALESELQELARLAGSRSPVASTIARPVDLTVELEKV